MRWTVTRGVSRHGRSPLGQRNRASAHINEFDNAPDAALVAVATPNSRRGRADCFHEANLQARGTQISMVGSMVELKPSGPVVMGGLVDGGV
jgi:hypothetical protein